MKCLWAALDARLIADWKWVLAHAVTVRICIAALVLCAVEGGWSLITGHLPISPVWNIIIFAVVQMLSMIFRVVAQRRISQGE